MKRIWLVLLLLTSCLSGGDWLQELRSGDYSLVETGRYPHTTKTMRRVSDSKSKAEWNELVADMGTIIEENIELLGVVTKHFFPEEENEFIFKYKFSSVDEERNRLILRYFAPIRFPRILAGYQCQFVVNLKDGKLEQILLSEVPLER